MKKALIYTSLAYMVYQFNKSNIDLLLSKGYEVEVACNFDTKLNPKGMVEKFKKELEDRGIKYYQIPIPKNVFLVNKIIESISMTKKLIKENEYDLIHVHSPISSVILRIAAMGLKSRVIYTVHGFHFYKGGPIINWLIFYPIEWFFAKYTDTIVTINIEDYNLVKEKFNKRCKDLRYVKGVGVDLNKFAIELTLEEKEELRNSLNLKEDNFVMIYPARLSKDKNHMFLFDVMEKILENNKNVHLLLPGFDEMGGVCQKIVQEKGLKDNVHFLGFRNDINKLQKISNIAVSSSLREGLPVNIIEALFASLPVVALNCRGMDDIVENGKNGFLIELDDPHKLEKFIVAIKTYYDGKPYERSHKENNLTTEEIRLEMDEIYFTNNI